MIDLLAIQPLTKPLYETLKPPTVVAKPVVEVKAVTEADNPNNCDENTQWIASEAPFYCISKQETTPAQNAVRPSENSSGNGYDPGQCTWGVKQKRPDIPNSWGNAYSWYASAQAQGWPTGTTPKVGAIGQIGDHVVYVEAVYGDGTILIYEMHYDWVLYDAREIVRPAQNYLYIY